MIAWPPSLIREQRYTNAMTRAGHDSPAPSRTAPGLLLVFGSFGDTFSLVSKCLQGARHSEEREEERKEKRKKKDRRKKNGVPKPGGAFVRQPGRRVRMRAKKRAKHGAQDARRPGIIRTRFTHTQHTSTSADCAAIAPIHISRHLSAWSEGVY